MQGERRRRPSLSLPILRTSRDQHRDGTLTLGNLLLALGETSFGWAIVLFSLLTLVLFSTLALAAQIPEKSPNDDNQYRFIELDNALKVILVSDQDADKAAASMNVAVGSGDDPADREGLSHFLEHKPPPRVIGPFGLS